MSTTSAILDLQRRAADIAALAGRAALHNQFPDDFEYYMCSIEIVDANDSNNVLDYITFPVMPEGIRISDQKIQNTTKTSNGVVTLENFSFVPKNITINGNFGRQFKLVAGGGGSFPQAITSDKVSKTFDKNGKLELPSFSLIAKTGYGMTKVLETIFNKSSSLSSGAPVLMFFYCPAFNANYLVQPINIQYSQNRQNMNMIWDYGLTMKAIAPADQLINSEDYQNHMNNYLKEDVIRQGVSSAIGFVSSQSKLAEVKLEFKAGEAIGLN